jgi:hypothetical protein
MFLKAICPTQLLLTATINSSKTFYILTSGNPNNDWDKEVVQN